jgi:hypothetical protein
VAAGTREAGFAQLVQATVVGPGRPARPKTGGSGRKRGAQPGHKGTYRALLAEDAVDAVHECPPPEVCECGGLVEPGRPWRH